MGYFYPDMCWNVLAARGSQDKIEPYNVFHHAWFCERLAQILMERRHKIGLFNEIKILARSCFWCRYEFEIIVSDWPRQYNEEKIDAYTQLEMNWEQFINYIIKNKKTIVKWYKENCKDE